jgi:hypothetical protein
MHIWGFFAEDGEESSVVMFGLGEKKAESGRAWIDFTCVSAWLVADAGLIECGRMVFETSHERLLCMSNCCS